MQSHRIAILIPCYNEAKTIGSVVMAFREQLPAAQVFVYDNNSTDDTAALARRAGAIVRSEQRQGKGQVVRRMFADIDADLYVLVDGDATYPASEVLALIAAVAGQQLDMAVAVRVPEQGAYRPKHAMGNKIFNLVLRQLFGHGMSDIFSGYRVMSRRFVKSFPAISRGFEIETELSVHALDLRLPFAEIPVTYSARPEGSVSKLNTWRDGFKILWMMVTLFKEARPLALFTGISALMALIALGLGTPLITTWLETGLVPRLPTAVGVTGLLVLSVISFFSGVILDGVAQARRENKRLIYLQYGPS